jgi:hypothetical protein
LAALKRELAEDDTDKRNGGTTFAHEITPSGFVQRALDIESSQYVCSHCLQFPLTLACRRRLNARDYDDGDDEAGSFHARRRTLSRNIIAIREPQRRYMNGIGHLLDSVDPILLADHPENIQLWLPSDLSPSTHNECCIPELPHLEYRLRYAIAMSALQDIRRFRQYSQAITAKTQTHISNTQKTVTRVRSQFERVQRKIKRAAATYRASWCAIGKLAPNEEFGPWKNRLRELRREDIRGPGREGYETSESRHVPSWIWQTTLDTSTSADKEGFSASLRVEWCKAQARAARYEEEVGLVIEEMRRTLNYFKWLANEWESRAASSPGSPSVDQVTVCGISAYAHKQAAIYRGLVDVFIGDWYGPLKQQTPALSWLSDYPPPSQTKRRRLVSNVRRYHPTSSGDSSDSSDAEEDDIEDGCMSEPAFDDDDLFEEPVD